MTMIRLGPWGWKIMVFTHVFFCCALAFRTDVCSFVDTIDVMVERKSVMSVIRMGY